MRFAYLIEPPFNFRKETGEIAGCDVELARRALAIAGFSHVEFIETEFSSLLSGLEDNRWDMTTGLFDTMERRQVAAFSTPIWSLADGLLVKKGNPKNVRGYASAAANPECRLAAINKQTQLNACLDAGVPASRILVFETYEEAVQAIIEGHADAYASVAIAHSGFLERHRGLELDIVPVSRSEKKPAAGAFAFRKKDESLRNAINSAIKRCMHTAEYRTMMLEYGFDDVALSPVRIEGQPSVT